MTIVSDQDKGSIVAIAAVLPRAFHFHCSWHRRQNITKKVGNKDGTEQFSANWMFNVLSNCKTHRAIQMKGNEYYQHMKKKEADYLLKLPDNVQYPAARCAMDRNVCMYGMTSSSGVESMNRPNENGVQNSTAVDPLNAGMRLIRLEIRFEKYKKLAWAHELPLTPKGMEGDIQYCPEWLAPNKAGRPKKNVRKLGPTDHIASSAKKRKTKRFCSICHKFNHNTVDCYLNPMNVRMQDNVPEEDNANVDGESGGI